MITSDIDHSLVFQTECPKCGASYTEMEKSLREGCFSDNYWNALIILTNCRVCQLRFWKEYLQLKGEG